MTHAEARREGRPPTHNPSPWRNSKVRVEPAEQNWRVQTLSLMEWNKWKGAAKYMANESTLKAKSTNMMLSLQCVTCYDEFVDGKLG